MSEKSISEIKKIFTDTDPEDEAALKAFEETYISDERAGVKALADKAGKKLALLQKEKARMNEMFSFEREYSAYKFICGIDEAGRGPLAGPVVAGAVILPKDCSLLYINDSKKLSEKKREELYERIKTEAVSYGIGYADNNRIDEINILNATYEAMKQAVGALDPAPDLLLIDAVKLPGIGTKQVPIIKGDALSASIAAASIMAKVTRDRLMEEYDRLYPEYGFSKNKGYGTADHIAALKKYGPLDIHRKSFIGNFIEI